METTVGARVPEEVLKDIEFVADEEKTDKSKVIRGLLSDAVRKKRLELALSRYARREVSLGKAAELAKVSVTDFMQASAGRVPLNYSVASLLSDVKAVRKRK